MSENATIINNDGTLAENWTSVLPEEIRGNEAWGNVKSINDLVTGYLAPKTEVKVDKFGQLLDLAPDDLKEAKTWNKFKDVDIPTALKAIVDMDKWTGKRGDIPQDGASPEEWKKFYDKLGVPEDPKAYEFGKPENVELDDATIDTLRNLAKKHNLSKKQEGVVSDMLNIYADMKKQGVETEKARIAEAQKKLDTEWRDQFDDMAKAVQSLEKHYGISQEDMDEIEANPKTLILLGRIAKDLDEKGQVGNVFSKTQIGLKDELADVEGQIRSILQANGRNVNDPKLDNLLDRRNRLQEKMS